MYKMCEEIIKANKEVVDVSYKLPNKASSSLAYLRLPGLLTLRVGLQHYIPIDLSFFKGLKNTKPEDAEVFVPVAAPSGYITATVSRA